MSIDQLPSSDRELRHIVIEICVIHIQDVFDFQNLGKLLEDAVCFGYDVLRVSMKRYNVERDLHHEATIRNQKERPAYHGY